MALLRDGILIAPKKEEIDKMKDSIEILLHTAGTAAVTTAAAIAGGPVVAGSAMVVSFLWIPEIMEKIEQSLYDKKHNIHRESSDSILSKLKKITDDLKLKATSHNMPDGMWKSKLNGVCTGDLGNGNKR